MGSIVDPPKWLWPVAAERWREVYPLLGDVVHQLDSVALAKDCQCYAQYRELQDWMLENGMTAVIRGEGGEIKSVVAVPHVAISCKMLSEMRHYEKAFGLTPQARQENLSALSDDYTDEELESIAKDNSSAGAGGVGIT